MELTTRPMQPSSGDVDTFAECFERNGSPRDSARVHWQYLANPEDKLLVDFTVAPDTTPPEIAAIYASIPVRVTVGGTTRQAIQSLDTLTDEKYRGRGLFKTMAEALYQRAAGDGVAFVYGFPNGNSAHGFFERLGWLSLDPVPFLIKPLRTRYVLSKIPRLQRVSSLAPDVRVGGWAPPRLPAGIRVRRIERFDERADALWRHFAAAIPAAVDRGAKYLNWRLVDKPGEEYRVLGAHEGDSLIAYVAFCAKRKHEGNIGYIMELVHETGRADVARGLLRLAISELALSGVDAVLAWNLPDSPNHGVYRRVGFITLPVKLRPIELHLGVRPFDETLRPLLSDRRNWYISYCDSDTV